MPSDDTGSPNPVNWMIAAGIATVLLAYFPLNELAYLCFGSETTAQVLNVQEYRSRRSSGFEVTYQYKVPGGGEQTDSFKWGRTGAPAPGGQVVIEYRTLPYASSRSPGVNWIGLLLFVAAAVATGYLRFIIVKQAREFREQDRERAERRKRKKRARDDEDD